MKPTKIITTILLIFFVSCTENFEEKINLRPLPVTISTAVDEAMTLREYAEKLNAIDVEKQTALLKTKKEKEEFKFKIAELKGAYNKCVDKLQDIEVKHPKDQSKKMRELKEYLVELDAIWKYTLTHYNL